LYFIYTTSLVFLILSLFTQTVIHVGTLDLENIWIAGCFISPFSGPECLLSEKQELGALSMIRSYPPWSLPVIALFSFGTLEQVKTTWLMLTNLGFAISTALIVCLTKDLQRSFNYIYPVSCCVLWFPVYSHLAIGQLTVLQLLGFIGFLIFNKNQSYYLAGLFLSISAIKPQTLWLLYLLLFLSLKRENLKVLTSFVASIAFLTLLGFYLKSDINTDFWPMRVNEVAVIIQPNLGSILQLSFGLSWRLIPAIVLSICSICFVFSKKLPNVLENPILMRTLTLSFLCSPYIGIHDMVIYLVPIIYLVAEAKNKLSNKNFTVFMLGLLLCLLLIPIVILGSSEKVILHHFIFLPLLLQIIFECSHFALKKYGQHKQS
jgi:hypothetical protein